MWFKQVLQASSMLVLFLFPAGLKAETPARLFLLPSAIELIGPDAHHRVLITSESAAGQHSDVTALATYVSLNPAVASITPEGECLAHGNGTTQITAFFQGKSVSLDVMVKETQLPKAPSFQNEVIPLFTRLGCNQGACHGKLAGQNGFRLSLRGYAPEWDYIGLTREFAGRRINAAIPDESLLLQKPLGRAPHGGGKLLQKGSREYQTLLDWLRIGMPGPSKEDPEIRRLEILPGNQTLGVGKEQQLLVRAEDSRGHWQDVTWLTRFDSNDSSVAAVDARGKVRILRHGETAVRASFRGLVAVTILTVPFDNPVPPETLAVRNNFIDNFVFDKLASMRIEPSSLCTDEVFLRRTYLDTIGVLPTPEEAREFLADHRPDKRGLLVDTLLDRPEFVDFWAMQLADLLQNRKESDHDVRGVKGVRAFHEWLRHQVAINRPWDQLARDVLIASGKVTDSPAVGYFVVNLGEQNNVPDTTLPASVAMQFLGTRIGCAKCHNHPLEKYTQDDYYRFAGFFSRIKMDRKEPDKGITSLLVSPPDPNQNKSPVGLNQPRTGQFLPPLPLDRSALEIKPGEDPRIKLAAWITNPKNDSFSGAMVNRLWRHFLGVGLVEPVDDLRVSNPPSNPELWQALNKEFVVHNFDMKHMMRLILNSRTYQLSSVTLPENERDFRFYSHFFVRRLPAEVLLDAVSQSTLVPEPFPGYPLGIRAQQLPDPTVRSYFLTVFGRPERKTGCACERNNDVTMPQLLHLIGGDTLAGKIRSAEGRLPALLKKVAGEPQRVEELFLATLSRPPTMTELAVIHQQLAEGENKEEGLRDLFWALLNSKEFAFNH